MNRPGQKMAKRALTLLSVFVAAFMLQWAITSLPSATAHACPLCADETEAQSERSGVNTSMGYFLSIVFMIGVPYGVISLFGFALYKNYRASQTGTTGSGTAASERMGSSGEADAMTPPADAESGVTIEKPDMTHPLYGDE